MHLVTEIDNGDARRGSGGTMPLGASEIGAPNERKKKEK